MPCEGCAAQFTLVRRKRSCADCGRHFCSSCASRNDQESQGPVCQSCRVLAARPLARHQLDRLRVRDLQYYLHRQRVSTAGCVEKKDLVNLVVAHVDGGNFTRRPPPRQPGEFAQAINTIKGFTANLFSSFDIGSHNGDKAKGRDGRQNDARPASFFGATSGGETTARRSVDASGSTSGARPARSERSPPAGTPPEAPPPPPPAPPARTVAEASPDDESQASETNLLDTNDCLEIEDDPDDPDWEIVAPPPARDSDVLLLDDDAPPRASARAASDLDLSSRTGDGPTDDTSSLKDVPLASRNSPSRIDLNNLRDFSQIEGLNVKQLKELLILNRVDFKGCCERKELLERAERLWRENTKSREGDLDNADHSELCKICMDAPMECIILECGHIATCVQCGKRLCECPICRQYVVRVVRFFRT